MGEVGTSVGDMEKMRRSDGIDWRDGGEGQEEQKLPER
jgi:hypothetical protein